MVTNTYVPATTVEIAWTSTYVTAYADHVWTDVTDWVELDNGSGITITGGRSDERASAEANQLRLTLDNRDGRFTAGRSASPYFPNVKVGRPIRVRTTVNAVNVLLFYSFVDEWPVRWEGTSAMSYVEVVALSRLARLGLGRPLRSPIEEEAFLPGPMALYILDEPAETTYAADTSGRAAPRLTQVSSGAPVTFGVESTLGVAGQPVVQFNGGRYLSASLPTGVTAVSFYFRSTAVPAGTSQALVTWRWAGGMGDALGGFELTGATHSDPGCVMIGNPKPGFDGDFDYSPPGINDGAWHHAVFTYDGTRCYVYFDGVTAGGLLVSGTGLIAPETITVGGRSWRDGGPSTAQIAGLALYGSHLSEAQVIAMAGVRGVTTDTVANQFRRIADYLRIAPADGTSDAATSSVAVDTAGSTLDALRLLEETEAGALYDRGYQTVLKARTGRYSAAAVASLSFNTQQIESEYAPKVDRSALLNDVTVTSTNGTAARETDETSITDYGVHATTVGTAMADPNDPQALASWLVASYDVPAPRVPDLVIDLLPLAAATQQALAAATLGDLLTVTDHPSQAATSSASYFIEGWKYDIGSASFFVAFNVSPAGPYLNTLIIGDAQRGVVGTNPIRF